MKKNLTLMALSLILISFVSCIKVTEPEEKEEITFTYSDIVGVLWDDGWGSTFAIAADNTWSNLSTYGNSDGVVVWVNEDANLFVTFYSNHAASYGTNYTNRYTLHAWQSTISSNLLKNTVYMTEITTGIYPDTRGFDTLADATNASTNGGFYSLYTKTN